MVFIGDMSDLTVLKIIQRPKQFHLNYVNNKKKLLIHWNSTICTIDGFLLTKFVTLFIDNCFGAYFSGYIFKKFHSFLSNWEITNFLAVAIQIKFENNVLHILYSFSTVFHWVGDKLEWRLSKFNFFSAETKKKTNNYDSVCRSNCVHESHPFLFVRAKFVLFQSNSLVV